jgi:hypothetical protein
MPNAIVATHSETKGRPTWPILVFVVAIVLLANAAVVLALLQVLSFGECALVIFSGGALTGGILFTIATLQRLGQED